MEDNLNYFQPKILDIRVGYEFEHFNLGEWKKAVVNKNTNFIYSFQKLKLGGLRTPYLTIEQIEAEGWKDVTKWFDESKKQYLAGTPNFEIKKEDGSFRLYLDMSNPHKGIIIERYKKGNGEPWSMSSFEIIYKGECPSINELRYICKLLKIK